MPRPVAFSKYSLSFMCTSRKIVYSVYSVYSVFPVMPLAALQDKGQRSKEKG
jgi:hypothetical protein